MSNLWVLPSDLGDQSESPYAAEAAQTASYFLWAMSGRKFSGVTVTTERYVRVVDAGALGMSAYMTAIENQNGSIVNVPITSHVGSTSSKHLRLRGRPVTAVHMIRRPDGEIVPPSDYYLADHSTIQFISGSLWDPYDLEVTYTYGAPPPTAGKMAARVFARELCKSWDGDPDCALPARVTSITRQGVSYTVLDNQDFIAELRTGVYEVDLFLKTANPDKARARSRVFSPDLPRARKANPKAPELAASVADITVHAGETTTFTLPFAAMSGNFLRSDDPWTLEVVLRGWGGTRSRTLEAGAYITDNSVVVTVPYAAALSVLKMVDPGTWDLYASKNGTIVHVVSGNLRIATK